MVLTFEHVKTILEANKTDLYKEKFKYLNNKNDNKTAKVNTILMEHLFS